MISNLCSSGREGGWGEGKGWTVGPVLVASSATRSGARGRRFDDDGDVLCSARSAAVVSVFGKAAENANLSCCF